MRFLLLDRTFSSLFSSNCTLVPTIHLDIAQWSTPQATADSGSSFWKRVSPQLSSPTQAYSMRDTMSSSQSQSSGKSSAQLRASLHPMLRHKLVSSICQFVWSIVKNSLWNFLLSISLQQELLLLYIFLIVHLAGCAHHLRILIIFLVSAA